MAKVLIGVVKVKALALLVGPAGVGLLGAFQSLVGTTSTLVGLGVNKSGVRQLAAARGDETMPGLVSTVLVGFNIAAGLVGAAILLVLREEAAIWTFGDADRAGPVGWLGAAVLLTLLAGSQMAVLQGRRRIQALATTRILSSVLGTAAGVLAVFLLGEQGIVPVVIAAPAATVLVATYFNWSQSGWMSHGSFSEARDQLQSMLWLGVPFMGAGLLTTGTQLYSRVLVIDELGLDAGGHFQAAWAISRTYLGVVLAAMAADYYPRLAQAMPDRAQAVRLVDEQSEVALLVGGPILIGMMGFAPLLISLLYSSDFAASVEVLRWQVFGDMLKLLGWPLGFIVIAQGRGALFLGTQAAWNGVYAGLLTMGISSIGLVVTGYAFVAAYLVVFSLNLMLGWRLLSYFPRPRIIVHAAGLVVVSVALLAAAPFGGWIAYGAATFCTLLVSVLSGARLYAVGWRPRRKKKKKVQQDEA